MAYRYFTVYKPYGILSQFTREEPHHHTLADLHEFPPDVYPVGRLDKDSEGLLVLTNDNALNAALLHPRQGHERSYLVQVEGKLDQAALNALKSGVDIRIKKRTWHTRPAKATLLDPAPDVPHRDPPIRYRKSVPTSWLRLTLTEGKNRQVRRMCAAVGFPVLRLIRVSIEGLGLPAGGPGSVEEWDGKKLKRLLKV